MTPAKLPTPRTDAFLIEGGNYGYAALADFARSLESELVALQKTNAMLADNWTRTEDLLRAARIRIDCSRPAFPK